ncbi:MAG: hypothetical protein JWQ89_4092 [Devosia sp.]|uniref:SH3 domain-containing protein n=1 Tax=Devosia sp. TaxID=1871048 RepID=UPI00262DEFCE|nr:SH3 domain-containing protein [Devosia sp.]MDB5542365.1 hypothetical protein [Devosia sp.]
MKLNRLLAISPIAVAAIITFAPAAALAQEVVANSGVPLHSGPGYGYSVAGELSPGSAYTVEQCTTDQIWCLVGNGRTSGWVEGTHLNGSAAKLSVTMYDGRDLLNSSVGGY